MNRISIVIPTYNRTESLEAVVKGLIAAGFNKNDELIIVDDGSDAVYVKKIESIIDNIPNAKIIRHEWNKGPAAARNTGINVAKNEIIFFTGDDMIPGKGLIDKHRKFHDEYKKESDALLGYAGVYNGIKITPFIKSVTEKGMEQFAYKALENKFQKVNYGYFYTCNISLKTDFLRRNGGFDEIFPFAAYEDIELGFRLSRNGLCLYYDPDAKVFHNHILELSGFIERQYRAGRSFYYFAVKHGLVDIIKSKLPSLNEDQLKNACKKARSTAEAEELNGESENLFKDYSLALYLAHCAGFVRELNFNNYNTKLIYENNIWKSIEILKREPGHNNGSDNNRFFISAMDGTEIGMYLAEDNNRKAVVFEPSDFAFFYASKKFDTKRIIRIVDFEEGIKIGMLKKTKTISDKNQDLEFYINTKKKPSICVIGPIYGGSLEIAEYAAEGFKQNGYETFYCDNSIFHKEMLHNAENPNMQSVILNKIMDLCYQRVLKTRADIIFALAQAPVSSFMIDEFKKKGILTAFWFVEDFRTLTYWKKIYRDYDIFFAIQDGAFINKINNTGGRAFYLPLAAPFPANTKTTGEIYRCEVSFVGAPYPNRINILTKIRSEDIAIFGEGWDAVAPQLKAIIGNRRVSRDEIRSIYANSKININLYSSLFDTGVEQHRDYINPRTFEIAACGGFQLSDYRKGIEDYFTPGEEIEVFMTVDELIEKIRYYKRNSGKAKQISLKAKEKVEKYHKYSDRMKIAVKIMETGRNYAKTL